MNTITAFMIVKNEETLLPRCFESMRGVVDELAILDTGSTDGTVAVVEQEARLGHFSQVQLGHHEFKDFGSARQANLDMVTTEYALWMDADELLSPMLRARLLEMRQGGHLTQYTGWEIHRANRVLGQVMKSRRLAANYVLRLFRTSEGHLSDSLVHEGMVLGEGATVGRLNEPILHDTLLEIGPYLEKVTMYTTLDVANPNDKKFNPFHLLITGPHTFIKDYFLRGGFVDGWPGLVWCAISGWTCVNRDWKRFKRDWLKKA
ncbi:MAG: glycosyltransferase family 2 protein [bacterium]|nr:glycosyltransferase family 2 protein [bacterium]